MKKSKIFLTTATLVLAVTAIFATKANKKFFSITSAKTNAGLGAANFIFKSNLSSLMTTANTGDQLKLHFGAASDNLLTVTNEHPIYLK